MARPQFLSSSYAEFGPGDLWPGLTDPVNWTAHSDRVSAEVTVPRPAGAEPGDLVIAFVANYCLNYADFSRDSQYIGQFGGFPVGIIAHAIPPSDGMRITYWVIDESDPIEDYRFVIKAPGNFRNAFVNGATSAAIAVLVYRGTGLFLQAYQPQSLFYTGPEYVPFFAGYTENPCYDLAEGQYNPPTEGPNRTDVCAFWIEEQVPLSESDPPLGGQTMIYSVVPDPDAGSNPFGLDARVGGSYYALEIHDAPAGLAQRYVANTFIGDHEPLGLYQLRMGTRLVVCAQGCEPHTQAVTAGVRSRVRTEDSISYVRMSSTAVVTATENQQQPPCAEQAQASTKGVDVRVRAVPAAGN